MKKKIRTRLLVIAAVILACGVFLYRNDINLGLDLQGGIHLVIQVDTEEVLQAEVQQLREQIEQRLREDNVNFGSVSVVGDSVQIEGVAADAENLVEETLELYQPAWNVRSTGGPEGTTYTLRMSAAYERELANQSVRQTREIISRRVDEYGVTEPSITIYGSGDIQDQIIVELPGVEDFQRVKDLIDTIAELELKLVHPTLGGPYNSREEARQAFPGGELPSDYEILPFPNNGRTQGAGYLVVKKAAALTGDHLKNARRSQDQFSGRSEVVFFLTSEGSTLFENVTGQNVDNRLAIVLDDIVQSDPNIQERIASESARITGDFSPEEADDLALSLRTGALPADIHFLEERSVGPSLGRDSILRGIYASLLGLVLVVVGMLIVYRLSGLNAVVCLALNLIILMSALASLNATLTLPGIAGIILTIGMAVDANILIFERVKEELRLGKTVRAAVEAGFGRVFWTIIDTNVTTLVAALFLFQFGTGPVKGFAVTLAIGLVANIFTATFVSRTLFALILQNREVSRLSV